MTTATASISLISTDWTLLGNAPLRAAITRMDYGASVDLRLGDIKPALGDPPHKSLNGSVKQAVFEQETSPVWAIVCAPGATATLDVVTGIGLAAGSGGSGGGGGGSNASVGSTGAAVPASATAIGFQNASGNLVLPTPAAGLPVDVAGVALDATCQAILTALQAQRAETIWTDDSGAFFVRIDNGGSISWLTISGGASSAPGTGARPAAGVNVLLDATRYQATVAGSGFAIGDYLSHVVTADPSSGAVIANFWLNVTQNSRLSSAPSSSNITPISPLPANAALETGGNLASIAANVSTAANQATGNSTLASILTKATAIAASLAGTLTTALAAGSNIIGYAGSLNFQTAPVVPTIQAAAYAAGNVIGGKQTVSIFRTMTQPSATLSQFLLGWAGTETVAITVYLFSKNPTNSTITDKAAFVLAAEDAQYLAAAPFTLTASASAGSTQTFAAQSLSLSVQNRDSSVTQNLYAVLVVGGAVTPAVGDLFFSISGVLD